VTKSENLMVIEDLSLEYSERVSLFRRTQRLALSRLSFSIRRGETLGIVGNNGSGKSTLLKVLAGIFAPDSGRIVRCYENISLLSISPGYDPELSGRENAILGGMLLGNSKQEMIGAIPEILDFAELNHVADQPMRTYSTGMRARLGFSVAFKTNAEVLLIDEILSVGDHSFQEKATEELTKRLNSSQTVVLVSHSLDQVALLCDRVLWINRGSLIKIGPSHSVIREYRDSNT